MLPGPLDKKASIVVIEVEDVLLHPVEFVGRLDLAVMSAGERSTQPLDNAPANMRELVRAIASEPRNDGWVYEADGHAFHLRQLNPMRASA